MRKLNHCHTTRRCSCCFSQSLSLHVLKLTLHTCVRRRTNTFTCLGPKCLHVFIHVCVCVLPPHHHRKSGRGRREVDHGAVNHTVSRAASRLAAARGWRVYKPRLQQQHHHRAANTTQEINSEEPRPPLSARRPCSFTTRSG